MLLLDPAPQPLRPRDAEATFRHDDRDLRRDGANRPAPARHVMAGIEVICHQRVDSAKGWQMQKESLVRVQACHTAPVW